MQINVRRDAVPVKKEKPVAHAPVEKEEVALSKETEAIVAEEPEVVEQTGPEVVYIEPSTAKFLIPFLLCVVAAVAAGYFTIGKVLDGYTGVWDLVGSLIQKVVGV